ncbi:MAG: hypothetical protein JJ964_13540 [Rhizobiales bacterium]|nr:hypothetical protein [Hyphomicrobiales bacterium]
MSDKKIKIADNPSIKELKSVLPIVKGIKLLTSSLKKLGLAGRKTNSIHDAVSDILKEEKNLYLPDQFNEAFSDKGWIVTNSFSMEVMSKALKLKTEGEEEAAEEEIISWFTEDNINLFAIHRSKPFNKASDRWTQLREALSLTIEQRYMAAVPLILIACDGFASDVIGTSPFEKNVDLSSFDSIVGHHSSLPKLIGKVIKGVRKSSDEELSIPLRHGILHGRSLGYANKIVCYKSWLLMIALVDWAIDVSSEKERKKELEHRQNFNLKEFRIQRKKLKEDRRIMDSFQTIEWLPPFGNDLKPDIPANSFIAFLEAWKNKNYGKMAKHSMKSINESHGQLAGIIRNDAELAELIKYEIKHIKQNSVARSEAKVFMQGKNINGIVVEGEFDILAFRYTVDDEIAMPDDRGVWLVQQNCIFHLMHASPANLQ